MRQTTPIDPGMRKAMLPSIIRISDALSGRTLSLGPGGRKATKTTVSSHALRAIMGQMRLELG